MRRRGARALYRRARRALRAGHAEAAQRLAAEGLALRETRATRELLATRGAMSVMSVGGRAWPAISAEPSEREPSSRKPLPALPPAADAIRATALAFRPIRLISTAPRAVARSP
jgi:hypothetical protein